MAAWRRPGFRDVIEVGDRDAVGQPEAVAQVALATTQAGRIDGEDDRAVARRLGARHQLLGDRAIAIDVELEPPRAVGRRGGDVLEARGGDGRDRHHRAGSRRSSRGRRFAVRMGETMERGRRHQDRKRRGGAEQGDSRVDPLDVHQHPRAQEHAFECRPVGT